MKSVIIDFSSREIIDRKQGNAQPLLSYESDQNTRLKNRLAHGAKDKESLLEIAMIHFKENNLEEAEKLLLSIQTHKKDFLYHIIHEKLGDIYFKQENAYKAKKYYVNSLLCVGSSSIKIKIGKCYEKMNDQQKALIYYYESIKDYPDYIPGVFKIGSILCKNDNLDEGIEFLEKAYEMDSNNPEIVIRYCLERSKISQEKARESIDILTKLQNKGLSTKYKLETSFAIAECHEKTGNIIECLSELEEMNENKLLDGNVKKLIYLGQIYEKSRKYNQALATFKKVFSIDNKNIAALHALAELYSHAKVFDKAIKYVKLAITIDELSVDSLLLLGKMYQSSKNHLEAIKAFERAAAIDLKNSKFTFKQSIFRSWCELPRIR